MSSFSSLVSFFSNEEKLPIPVDEIVDWIRNNTDHKNIKLHPVKRDHKAFRGAFVRTSMPSIIAYNTSPETLYRVFYGEDMEDSWKRLVIVKELLHVFDEARQRVSTEDGVKRLISGVIAPVLNETPFAPVTNDKVGPFRAMMILLPENARIKLRQAVDDGDRTVEEVADYCMLPPSYVDIWLQHGNVIQNLLNEPS